MTRMTFQMKNVAFLLTTQHMHSSGCFFVELLKASDTVVDQTRTLFDRVHSWRWAKVSVLIVDSVSGSLTRLSSTSSRVDRSFTVNSCTYIPTNTIVDIVGHGDSLLD